MFPLWDVAIAPVLHAVRRASGRRDRRAARRDHRQDARRPRSRRRAARHRPGPRLRPERARAGQFPGRYVFHEALSLDVLPTLEPMDAALIDGDHNWYTVYNELRLLADGARRAGAPLPVMIMHDVLWPYGRRDLYYAPEQIPEEFRQPYAQKGMRPGGKKLLERGGLNPTMCNALEEGGAAQRRDDRGRRLRRRVRPAAARRGPADLLRARDRGRGGAPGPPARAGGRARPPRGRGRAPGAARGRRSRCACGR